ncbi:MAG: AsmA family protein, partial [Gammaproteobacteria bacterium]|nr:AsmA family protein [Gammaproteobacteria bacterium]
MPRFAVVVAIVLATPLILTAVLLLILVLILESAETYRDQITTSVKASTGYNLTIGGQLSWRYWPPIALDVSDVVINLPGDGSKLASLENGSIDLDLLPLLTGDQTISVQALSLQGLMLHPMIDKDGHGNWEVSDETSSTTAAIAPDSATEAEKSPSRFALNIDGIDIRDVTVDYQDEASGEHYILEITSLVTGSVQYGQPVMLEIEAQARDVVNQIRTVASIQGVIVFDENLDKLGFMDLSLSNSVHTPDMEPVVLAMTFSGELDIAKKNLEVQLAGTLDDSTITGSLEVTSDDSTRLTFDLSIDAINASRYLKTGEVADTQHASSKPAIEAVASTQR